MGKKLSANKGIFIGGKGGFDSGVKGKKYTLYGKGGIKVK